jgi:hypothetical protein
VDYPWDIKVTDETHTQNSTKKFTIAVDLIFHDIKKGCEGEIRGIVRAMGAEFVWNNYDEKTETAIVRATLVDNLSDTMQEYIDTLVRDLAYSVHAKAATIQSIDVEELSQPTTVASEVKEQEGLTA